MSQSTPDSPADRDTLFSGTKRRLNALVSDLVRRANLAQELGQSWGDIDDRDYYDTLGYPLNSELRFEHFEAKFQRQDIARSIVEIPPSATWRGVPSVMDDEDVEETTDFERDVDDLFATTQAVHHLERADVLQRIGQFGVMVIGLDDSNGLADPVARGELSGVDDILFHQPFSQKQVEEFERDTDETSERFMLPQTYEIDFGEDDTEDTREVHHERVIHLAEGSLEDEVIGTPALKPVFNLLVDLLKVVGGSAEMFWRDAKQRLIASLDPEMGHIEDEEELETQVEEFVNELRDVIQTRGMEVDEIEGGSPDPSGLKDAIIELLSGYTRIPKRRLLGTERGDLASSQDESAFVGVIEGRRESFAGPQVLRQYFDSLVDYNVLSQPTEAERGERSYRIDWPDLFELTEIEEAEVMQRRAKAYKDVSAMGDPSEVATKAERREEVLDLPAEPEGAMPGAPAPGPAPVPGPEDGDGDGDGAGDQDDIIEDVDDVDDAIEDVLDETDPEVREAFEDIHDIDLDDLVAAANGGLAPGD